MTQFTAQTVRLPEKVQILKDLLGIQTFTTADFWIVCPHRKEELLVRDKRNKITAWRSVGMVWYVLSGYTATDTAKHLLRDHASVLNAITVVTNALQVGGHKLITDIIHEVKIQSSKRCFSGSDSNLTSALDLESQIYKLRPYLFDESQFYCNIHALNNRPGATSMRCQDQCNACRA